MTRHATYCRCWTRPYGLMSLLERLLAPRQTQARKHAPRNQHHSSLDPWAPRCVAQGEAFLRRIFGTASMREYMCASLPGQCSPRWDRAVLCTLQRVPLSYSARNHSNDVDKSRRLTNLMQNSPVWPMVRYLSGGRIVNRFH